jgi:hypothetical protein
MADNEKISHNRREPGEQKRSKTKPDSEPFTEHFRAWDEGYLAIGETPFQPQAERHMALLTKARSDGQRADIAMSLQQTYGNLYVQRLIKSMDIQAKPRERKPSEIIPDLDEVTVDYIKPIIKMAKSKVLRQDIIDTIVSDKKGKGQDFSIMEKGKPVYLDAYPSWIPKKSRDSNGITLRPGQNAVCTGDKPCVFILPKAFDVSNEDECVLRVYSTIMHEYQHALQWQEPEKAEALGKAGREVGAFFWEIENSDNTGLSKQKGPFRNTWEQAIEWWEKFKKSEAWRKLGADEKKKYIDWHNRVSKKANEVLGKK